ncbi:MAG: FumA C-terminus/TtdB family hydratase beta subunit [Anaerolineae bacterium]|jgi:fumarate hydratase class I
MATFELTPPISEAAIRALHIGDAVRLSGVIITARDAAHKYLVETFIKNHPIPESEQPLYKELGRLLNGGVIYHCGPVVRPSLPQPPPQNGKGVEEGWQFVAAGPTTSIREEPYEPDVIAHFGLRGVIGKGGMGPGTLRACQEHGAVYFHAVGGAATLIANTVKKVLAVHKLDEFGTPEAMWVINVENLTTIVTMDAHGQSIHDQVEAASRASLEHLLSPSH